MAGSLWALGGLVLLAFAVETAAGFGSAVVALTLGGLFLPLPGLMAVLVPLNLAVSTAVLIRDRHAVEPRLLAREVLPPLLVGLIAGIALAGALRGLALLRAYAVFVVAVAGVELWRARRTKLPMPLSGRARWGWLLAGGLIHGLFTASGPLIVFALGRLAPEKTRFRANLAAIWLVLNGLWLASAWSRGLMSRHIWLSALAMVPAMGVGMAMGEALHRKLRPAQFRTAVYALVLAGGCTLLVAG